jgi:hypothetical protein
MTRVIKINLNLTWINLDCCLETDCLLYNTRSAGGGRERGWVGNLGLCIIHTVGLVYSIFGIWWWSWWCVVVNFQLMFSLTSFFSVWWQTTNWKKIGRYKSKPFGTNVAILQVILITINVPPGRNWEEKTWPVNVELKCHEREGKLLDWWLFVYIGKTFHDFQFYLNRWTKQTNK